jgi:hypothetical protein
MRFLEVFLLLPQIEITTALNNTETTKPPTEPKFCKQRPG